MAERSLCCQTPEVGAECLNWARSDLCGGRAVMHVPTAIGSPLSQANICRPMWLLVHLLNRFIRDGELRLIAADGSLHIFGSHGLGPTVTVRLHDPRLYIKLFLN